MEFNFSPCLVGFIFKRWFQSSFSMTSNFTFRSITEKQANKRTPFFFLQKAATHYCSQFSILFLTEFKHIECTNGFFLADAKASFKFTSFMTSLLDLTLLNLLQFLRCLLIVAPTIAFPVYISYCSSGGLFKSSSSYACHPSHRVSGSLNSLLSIHLLDTNWFLFPSCDIKRIYYLSF